MATAPAPTPAPAVLPQPPTPFGRGATFSFSFQIPDTIVGDYFSGWQVTAQIRKKGNDAATGLIADLACFWADPKTNRILVMHHALTAKWSTGLAEVDVLFTSPEGTKIRSSTINFLIQRGITK